MRYEDRDNQRSYRGQPTWRQLQEQRRAREEFFRSRHTKENRSSPRMADYGLGDFAPESESGRHNYPMGGYAGKDKGSEGIWGGVNDFFGVGPKGYKRSDERIREDVSEALSWDPDVDASQIELEVRDGNVILSGSVSNRWMKRRAEDCADEVFGVNDVRNKLDVIKGDGLASGAEHSRSPSTIGAAAQMGYVGSAGLTENLVENATTAKSKEQENMPNEQSE